MNNIIGIWEVHELIIWRNHMGMEKVANIKKSLIVFITITLLSGWLGVFIDSILIDQPEGDSLGMLIWLVLPFLTGIIIRIKTHDWKDFGIKFYVKKKLKWYIFAVMVYPVITIITIGIAYGLKSINFSNFNLDEFISLAVFMIISSFFKNIFEEFSWRGFLTPKLIDTKLNDWWIYLISGLVWALWHAPYYFVFLPDSYFTSISRLGMVIVGCLVMGVWNIFFVELYRITKSVWPCVIMHAVEDAIPTVLISVGSFITLTKGSSIWLDPITGVLSISIFLILGLLLRRYRIKMEEMI